MRGCARFGTQPPFYFRDRGRSETCRTSGGTAADEQGFVPFRSMQSLDISQPLKSQRHQQKGHKSHRRQLQKIVSANQANPASKLLTWRLTAVLYSISTWK